MPDESRTRGGKPPPIKKLGSTPGRYASMIDDLDIWRAANLLVKRHGADAALVAARRADDLLADGDAEGCAIWKRILEAVGELSRTTPAEGERVN